MAESKQPTAEQLRNFRDHPRQGAIHMINLLKFRERARYQDGEVEDGDISGREAYLRYGAAVGGIAVKEILDEVTSTPHTEDFARSLEAGSVILWVR
ncbi:MAG: hypothetical protein QGF20_10100, partial [Alphaproteobacteria bacterium]|nr:hypothetical protein [Alphaproteobacteria bacterium]